MATKQESAKTVRVKTGEELARDAEMAAKLPQKVAEQGDPAMEEMVTIRLAVDPAHPRDNEVTVGLNGRFWKIQRGHTVQVPAAVGEILAHSERQTAAAMASINGAAQG